MRWINGGAHQNEDKHMEHVAGRVVPQLEPQQPGLVIDREVHVEMTVQFVMEFSALTDARYPVLEELNRWVQFHQRTAWTHLSDSSSNHMVIRELR